MRSFPKLQLVTRRVLFLHGHQFMHVGPCCIQRIPALPVSIGGRATARVGATATSRLNGRYQAICPQPFTVLLSVLLRTGHDASHSKHMSLLHGVHGLVYRKSLDHFQQHPDLLIRQPYSDCASLAKISTAIRTTRLSPTTYSRLL